MDHVWSVSQTREVDRGRLFRIARSLGRQVVNPLADPIDKDLDLSAISFRIKEAKCFAGEVKPHARIGIDEAKHKIVVIKGIGIIFRARPVVAQPVAAVGFDHIRIVPAVG